MIKKLYEEAGRIQAEAHAAKEANKVGVLRGGTTGALDSSGDPVGHCHRKALARFLGIEKSAGSKQVFDMGFGNEAVWVEKLKLVWPYEVRCEENIPIAWDLDGTPVTGRPDIVLLDKEGEQVAGVELKALGAINSALGIFFEDKPKAENLFQAAHYSSQLAVPFYLVYTFNGKGPLPYWATKKFGAKELGSFIREFKVEVRDDGQLIYTRESGEVVVTPYTLEGIKDFYRLVVDMSKEKSLYKRYEAKDITGTKLPYNACDNKYCTYSAICDKFEDNYERWVEEALRIKEIG